MSKFVNRANFLQILIPVILILFISSGCSSKTNDSTKDTDSSKNEYVSFQSLFENNPIDKAFEAEMLDFNGSTLQEFSYARKLKIHWEKELHKSYDILIKLLDDDDKIALEASQRAWDEYINNIDTLNNHIYYLPERKYTILEYNANYMFDLAETTKNRAFELMRWIYAFTGEVEFVFDKW